jgi:hypothetical protein
MKAFIVTIVVLQILSIGISLGERKEISVSGFFAILTQIGILIWGAYLLVNA